MSADSNVYFQVGSSNSGTQVGINSGIINCHSSNADLLDRLPIARGAELDSYTDQHEDECLDGTRTDLLHKVTEWVLSPSGKCIFWLNGMAGTGKSTISRTVARSSQREKLVTVTFFFKRGEGDRGNATKFFPTIVRQLVTKLPGLEISVRAAFSNDFDVGKKSLGVQFEELLLQPLSDLDKSNSFLQVIPITVVMVIDALDECNTDDDIQVILLLLPKLQKLNAIRVRIFLTSRPELPIGLGFSKMSNDQYQYLVLHEMPEEMASHDISLFLKDRLWKIQDKKDVPRDWPGEDAIRALVAMSVPLFISAATVCRYVESRLDPVEGLADIIKDQAKYSTRMDKTYLPILVRFLDAYEEIDKDQILQYYQQIVGTIILLAASFSVNTLSRFLGLQERLILNLLNSFQSVLRLPSTRDQPVQILHKSFPDFLHGTTSGFYIDKNQTHKNIALHCLQIMRNQLKKNICDLKGYGTKRIEINEELITRNLQPELQYSCHYWVHHLENCMNEKDINQEALSFLYEHFLHWVEAMAILGLASEMVTIINALQTITQKDDDSTFNDFLHDANRFILKFLPIVNDAPLQTYCAGLVFAPEASFIRQKFIEEAPPSIYQVSMQDDKNWSSELQTLEGHTSGVCSVAFSADGRLLASGSLDDTVRLWNSATGALLHTLRGHSDKVTSLAFSPTHCLLASGSLDDTIRIWNSTTGELQHTLEDRIMDVSSLAFSPDGRLLASGCQSGGRNRDDTIRLWDVAIGTLQQTLKGITGGVNYVVFSSDGKLLASGSGSDHYHAEDEDNIVRIWDTATGELQQTIERQLAAVLRVAFSPDGCLLASASSDRTVCLWDTVTGALRRSHKDNFAGTTPLLFSSDSRLLVSNSDGPGGVDDEIIQMWDPITRALLQLLESHAIGVTSIAFSPDGCLVASGHPDSTVRLWDPTTDQAHQKHNGHHGWVTSLALSPNGNLIASGSRDKTIRLWDAATGALQQVLKGHSAHISHISFSPDSCLLVSGCFDGTLWLWESSTGVLRQTLERRLNFRYVYGTFSPDGLLLASTSGEPSIQLWDPIRGTLNDTFDGDLFENHPTPFSPDMKLLASYIWDRNNPTILLRDLVTGELKQTLEGSSEVLHSVAFSPDGRLLACGYEDNTIRLWELTTGAVLQMLEGQFSTVTSLAFSPDSLMLAFSSRDRTVWLWNLATNALQRKVSSYDIARDLKFSQDGSYLSSSVGVFHTQSQLAQAAFELYIDNEYWICINQERVLWLPVDFRPECSVVYGNKVALGRRSGQVSILGFRAQ